jgi:hypothetical protein
VCLLLDGPVYTSWYMGKRAPIYRAGRAIPTSTYISVCSLRYIFRRLSAILSSDLVVRSCGQILSSDSVDRFCLLKLLSTFIEPSAKTTRARVFGTNQRSRARLIMCIFGERAITTRPTHALKLLIL